jgi:putative peptidoglycan lipid II flippase
MLPHSVITISIMTALLPQMSRAAAARDFPKVGAYVSDGMRLVSVLIIPAAVCLGVAGPMIATVIFGFGAGSGAAATYAGLVVMAFAIGLLPFSLFYVLLRGWYSLEDTKTPFFLTIVYNVLMVAISIPLFAAVPVETKVMALAGGYSIAYWLTLAVAWTVLSRRLRHLHSRQTLWIIVRLLAAGVVAAAAGFAVNLGITQLVAARIDKPVALGFIGMPGWAFAAAIVCSAVAVVVYLGLAWLFRVQEISQAWQMVASKVPGLRSRVG